MSAASTSTSSAAPDVNSSRAAYSACIPEAQDELNTGKSSSAHCVPSRSAFESKPSSQLSAALPLQDAINSGVLPAVETSASAVLASACQRATPERVESIPAAGKQTREMFDSLALHGNCVAARNDCDSIISEVFPCALASPIPFMA